MFNNLKELHKKKEITPKEALTKLEIRIKMKEEQIKKYKEEIGL